MNREVNVDRRTAMLLPVELKEWVQADDVVHLVIEAVDQMDLRAAVRNERGTGSAQYPAGMMLALLIYCYTQELYSSRRIERATHTHVAVRYLTGDTHPDHDTIASFRRRNPELLRAAFREVLQVAQELGVLRLGTVFLDGTKLKANAARRANRREAELRALEAEIAARLSAAEQADQTEVTEQLPADLADAKARQAKLAAARAALRQRAEEQKRPPHDDDLGNTTDPDSRPQQTSQGWIQGYNAQVACTENGLIVAADVCTDNQDRRQLAPMVRQITAIGVPHTLVADTGYDHHAQIQAVEQATAATVYIPPQLPVEVHTRQSQTRARRSAERAHRLARVRSATGQALLRQRQRTIEPIFGIIKSARRFERFLTRGLAAVRSEWWLVCTAFNLRRLHRLLAQPAA